MLALALALALALSPASAAAPSSEIWSTWFGFDAPCAGPYDVAVSLFAATTANASAAPLVGPAFGLAPLLMSSVGGMWAALSTDTAGNRAWQTWCLMDGTVILTQASLETGRPRVDGVCQIPLILFGITYYDARVEARGPFMFFDDIIMAFWMNTNGSDAAEASRLAVPHAAARARSRRTPTAGASPGGPPRWLREGEAFVPPDALPADERARIAAFRAATPLCGSRNVSTFADFEGSWMMRFDGGLLERPTALTLSDAEESNDGIVATFYDVLTGTAGASTQRMNFTCNNGGKPCFGEYAWMSWRNETLLLSADDDFRQGASLVVLGEPRAWLAAPAAATLATLDGIGAEGTSSFTASFEAASAGSPFPLVLQQITDNSFSCKPSPTTDQVVGFDVLDAAGTWREASPASVVTCPAFGVGMGEGEGEGEGAAAARSCMTPLVVAWAPLVSGHEVKESAR